MKHIKMYRNKLFNLIRDALKMRCRTVVCRYKHIAPPVTMGLITTAYCNEDKSQVSFDVQSLEHEFLIRQATTVNVNAATQLLTVTIVAIQDTSERLRQTLSKEICLIKQAMEWGDGTPPQHWDELVAVRGTLCDLRHNLLTLFGYMDYAEKLATAAAEISYLSGNIAASDAICERINHINRVCTSQKQMNHDLQQECLDLQHQAIINTPDLEDRLKMIDDTKKRK